MWSLFKKKQKYNCPICGSKSDLLDTVDFNKSCEEAYGKFLPRAGIAVSYFLCAECRFCWAPILHTWSIQEFEDKIYNQDYIQVDPDYVEARPQTQAKMLTSMPVQLPSSLKHVDYGGGNGTLTKLLNQAGWNSISYDPFVNRETKIETLGKFGLITSFEVFEHVPDVHKLINDLNQLIATDGIIIFSTLISDDQIHPGMKLNWWYASPRNGHISLFSSKSLGLLADLGNFQFASFSPGLHAFFRTVPTWAADLLK
jgi:SAM-dependent methyltransferase